MMTPSQQKRAPSHHAGEEASAHRFFRDSLEFDVEMDTDVIDLDDFNSVASVARLVTESAKGAA